MTTSIKAKVQNVTFGEATRQEKVKLFSFGSPYDENANSSFQFIEMSIVQKNGGL